MRNLELVHMAHEAHKRPAEISGGMKQRVGFGARACHGAKVLAARRAVRALDALTRAQLQDAVQDITTRLGNTVVRSRMMSTKAVLLPTAS